MNSSLNLLGEEFKHRNRLRCVRLTAEGHENRKCDSWFCLCLTDAVVSQITSQALPLVFRVILPLPQLELFTGHVLVLRLPLRHKQLMKGDVPALRSCPSPKAKHLMIIYCRRSRATPPHRGSSGTDYTHSFLALSAETLAAHGAGDLELVSIVDKPIDALRRRKTNTSQPLCCHRFKCSGKNKFIWFYFN